MQHKTTSRKGFDELYLRKAESGDCDLLFAWANDKTTRQNSFSEDEISYETHVEWFNKLLADENRCQLILMFDDEPVGQIRLTITDGVAEIGYSVDPLRRGYGFGKRMLALVMDYIKDNLPNVTRVIGQVKPSNVASYKAFVDNGFEEKYKSLEIEVSAWSAECLDDTNKYSGRYFS